MHLSRYPPPSKETLVSFPVLTRGPLSYCFHVHEAATPKTEFLPCFPVLCLVSHNCSPKGCCCTPNTCLVVASRGWAGSPAWLLPGLCSITKLSSWVGSTDGHPKCSDVWVLSCPLLHSSCPKKPKLPPLEHSSANLRDWTSYLWYPFTTNIDTRSFSQPLSHCKGWVSYWVPNPCLFHTCLVSHSLVMIRSKN